MTWFGCPNVDVTEAHHLVCSEMVSASVSTHAPSEINCVLQQEGTGEWDAEMERGQAGKVGERGVLHMVRWRRYVCLALGGSIPSACRGLAVIGWGAVVLGDEVSGWWAERPAFTFLGVAPVVLILLWVCC